MINDDCISRKMAVEAIEGIVSSMSVCFSVDECHGMKRMQKRAIEEVKNLPPIQYNARMSNTELKPCPFCGEKARLQPIGDSYYVTCDGSYCKIKPTTWAYIVKERAIEEWNKRGSVDVSEKVVSVQTVRCKNCKYAHMTISGSCKYCDQFTDDYGQLIEMYFDKDFFCGYAERKAE